MNNMALKGIYWVGNMYQKFEEMCVEVEETMYQDTVQYVENQVQTVGACVKKFYSDVIHDLHRASLIDPVKTKDDYADIGIYEKPKANIKKEPVKVEIKQPVQSSYVSFHMGKQGDDGSSSKICTANNLCRPLSENPAQGQWSEWDFDQDDPAELDSGGKENSGDTFPSFEVSKLTASVARNCLKPLTDGELHRGDEAMHYHGTLGSLPAFVSEGRISKETVGSKECICSITFCSRSSNANSDNVDSEGKEMAVPSNGDLSSEPEVLENNGMETTIDENMQKIEILDEALCGPNMVLDAAQWGASNHSDEIVSEDADEKGAEHTRQLDTVKLDESCVLVDRNEHFSTSHLHGKQKSHKMKIRDAFSPRRWIALTHEDGGLNREIRKHLLRTNTMDSGKKNSGTLNAFETEWELL